MTDLPRKGEVTPDAPTVLSRLPLDGAQWFLAREDGLWFIEKTTAKNGDVLEVPTRLTFEPLHVAGRLVPRGALRLRRGRHGAIPCHRAGVRGMSNVVPLRGAQNGATPAPLRSPLQPTLRASLGGSGRLWWHRARLTVEAVGWIVLAASISAAIIG